MKRGWTPERLRQLMETMALSEQALAARLPVSQLTVQRWLRGVHEPTSVYCRLLEQMERRLAKRREKAAAE
jgi:DNA-binding transcriptional regulator YiaG